MPKQPVKAPKAKSNVPLPRRLAGSFSSFSASTQASNRSVTAPMLAVETSFTYFAINPRL
jgi:hypothetical protein